MDARALLAALKRRREVSVEVEPGKKIFFTRPPEAEMGSMLVSNPGEKTGTWVVTIAHVRKYVTGWSGFTEADILGAAVGAADEVAFDSELWAEMVGDNIEWVGKIADGILKSIVDHLAAQEVVAKNSEPAST